MHEKQPLGVMAQLQATQKGRVMGRHLGQNFTAQFKQAPALDFGDAVGGQRLGAANFGAEPMHAHQHIGVVPRGCFQIPFKHAVVVAF